MVADGAESEELRFFRISELPKHIRLQAGKWAVDWLKYKQTFPI